MNTKIQAFAIVGVILLIYQVYLFENVIYDIQKINSEIQTLSTLKDKLLVSGDV